MPSPGKLAKTNTSPVKDAAGLTAPLSATKTWSNLASTELQLNPLFKEGSSVHVVTERERPQSHRWLHGSSSSLKIKRNQNLSSPPSEANSLSRNGTETTSTSTSDSGALAVPYSEGDIQLKVHEQSSFADRASRRLHLHSNTPSGSYKHPVNHHYLQGNLAPVTLPGLRLPSLPPSPPLSEIIRIGDDDTSTDATTDSAESEGSSQGGTSSILRDESEGPRSDRSISSPPASDVLSHRPTDPAELAIKPQPLTIEEASTPTASERPRSDPLLPSSSYLLPPPIMQPIRSATSQRSTSPVSTASVQRNNTTSYQPVASTSAHVLPPMNPALANANGITPQSKKHRSPTRSSSHPPTSYLSASTSGPPHHPPDPGTIAQVADADGFENSIARQADEIRRERQTRKLEKEKEQQQQQQQHQERERSQSKGRAVVGRSAGAGGAEPAALSERALVGNLISEGHANYVLMYNMLTGIRIGVSSLQAMALRKTS